MKIPSLSSLPLAQLPSLSWLRGLCILQLITCVALVIASGATQLDLSGADSPWYYSLQIPVSIAVFIIIIKVENEQRRARWVLAYASVTMILGLISSFWFMVFSNDLEIAKQKCSDITFNLTSVECSDNKKKQVTHIARTAVYLFVQIMCIHPAVSYVIELWSNVVTAVGSTSPSRQQ
eukprot:Opistho-2@77550